MQTVALVGAAVFICVVFGIPFGIWFGKSVRTYRAAEPVLDLMQTLPAFVYLIGGGGLGKVILEALQNAAKGPGLWGASRSCLWRWSWIAFCRALFAALIANDRDPGGRHRAKASPISFGLWRSSAPIPVLKPAVKRSPPWLWRRFRSSYGAFIWLQNSVASGFKPIPSTSVRP